MFIVIKGDFSVFKSFDCDVEDLKNKFFVKKSEEVININAKAKNIMEKHFY